MRYVVLFGLAVFFTLSFFAVNQKGEDEKAVTPVTDLPPESAIPPEKPVQEAAVAAKTPTYDDSIREEVLHRSRRSTEFSELPEPDQQWVVIEAANAYATGQVSLDDLVQHIDELSSVRMFKVIEREAPYISSMDMDGMTEQ